MNYNDITKDKMMVRYVSQSWNHLCFTSINIINTKWQLLMSFYGFIKSGFF